MEPQIPILPLNRQCGSCFSCCVWIGVTDLKKHAGKSCTHLSGAGDPTKRCQIYPSRPSACSRYQCGWLEGLGTETDRPDKSGFIVTVYHGHLEGCPYSAVFQIFDPQKSGDWQDEASPLGRCLRQLAALTGQNDIKLVYPKTKTVIFFWSGNIYAGRLKPQKSYENLSFEVFDPPIGKWEVQNV